MGFDVLMTITSPLDPVELLAASIPPSRGAGGRAVAVL